MAIENRWNAVLCDLRSADTLSFGPGVLHSALDASPYHSKFQLTEKKCLIHSKGLVSLTVHPYNKNIHFLISTIGFWKEVGAGAISTCLSTFGKKRTKKMKEQDFSHSFKNACKIRKFGLLEVPLQQAFQGLAVSGLLQLVNQEHKASNHTAGKCDDGQNTKESDPLQN